MTKKEQKAATEGTRSAIPMAMHVAFPYVDILRYGGEIPGNPKGTAIFACPDVDTLNVFKIERIDEK